MTEPLARSVQTRESEAGSAPGSPEVSTTAMSGTAAQVEWAERIRDEVSAEFDRVAALFQSICRKEQGATRRHAEDILGILEEKRAEVMSKGQAAYFIRNWREIDGQVRRMILQDPRCHQDESIPAQRL